MYGDFNKVWLDGLCQGKDEAWQYFLESDVGRRIKRRCDALEFVLKKERYLRQEEGDDLFQECLIAIYKAAVGHRQKEDSALGPGFFWCVAKRACSDVLRRVQSTRQREGQGTKPSVYRAPDVQDESGQVKPAIELHQQDLRSQDPFDDIEWDDLIRRTELTQEQKSVITLWRQGYSLADIAKRSEQPQATIRSRFLSALVKLRKRLGE